MNPTGTIVNDVTGLNPVPVWAVVRPETVQEVVDAIGRSSGPISVGGGHFSMGGQTASPQSLHLDLRRLNKVVHFAPLEKTIRVQAGIRWCDVQRFIDPHGLAVKIMQTYANFTVGGSLSVNAHGRYVGAGPVILSVRRLWLVLMNGETVEASRTRNAELFFGAIGGYGGLGIIVEAELDLVDNLRVERIDEKLATRDYLDYFRKSIRHRHAAVFHNADLYAPHYRRLRAVTWFETKKPATVNHRLRPLRRIYALEKYFTWTVSESPLGKLRREYLIDPLLYLGQPVHWRNFEAGYDVAELEPVSRQWRTYVLQEYFVPVERFDAFVPLMAEILQRHRVNVLNVSVRHAEADEHSLLSWARQESFAFVLYYKQRTRDNARDRVAVWTRELIDAALAVGGTYYLPYQPHARCDQFHAAYPRAREFFALKRRFDPGFRLHNALWDRYYAPELAPGAAGADAAAGSGLAPASASGSANDGAVSDFHTVYGDGALQDGFYRFLQNVYRLFPEDRFHTMIRQACERFDTDEDIYRHLQQQLPTIKPTLAELTYALPSLAKQKREMTRQTLELLGPPTRGGALNGYLEIGTPGRYVKSLRQALGLKGLTYLISETPVGNSPVDLVERGQLGQVGPWQLLDDYAPIAESFVPTESVDLASCFIGLHHVDPGRLDAFVDSIWRVLRPGGRFILRDHDVTNPGMNAMASLAHTVFNAGLGVSWEENAREPRFLVSIDEWVRRLTARGFTTDGRRLLQAHDPSLNTLMLFTKVARPVALAA